MVAEFFVADRIDFTINERRQYERIKKIIQEADSEIEGRICLVVDYTIKDRQLDLLVIKPNALINIELKAYKGKIIGSENGEWEVITADGKKVPIDRSSNPFQQVKKQRFALLDFMNMRLSKIAPRFVESQIHNVSSIVCFESGSTFDMSQMDNPAYPWFSVCNEDEIIEAINNADSREFLLKDVEILDLVKAMKLHKLDNGKKTIEPSKGVNEEDLAQITVLINQTYGAAQFTLEDLGKLIDPVYASNYLSKAILNGVIVKDATGAKRFSLSDAWALKLPAVPEDDDAEGGEKAMKVTDFHLFPKKHQDLKPYDGIYRGTTYHIDYNRNVWWQASAAYPRIKALFEDEEILERIIEVRPQGGSFRITEHGEILTKIMDSDGEYVPIFVGMMKGKIELDQLTWKPKSPKDGNLWPSIYDGTKLSVNTGGGLMIHIGNRKAYAKSGHEELTKKVLHFIGRYGGGSFRINENGAILVLMHRAPYPAQIEKQFASLSDVEKRMLDIRRILDKDDRVPIHIGNFEGNIEFGKIVNMNDEWTAEEDSELRERLGLV